MLQNGTKRISIVGCCLLVSLFMASASYGQSLLEGMSKAGRTVKGAVAKKAPRK